MPDDQTGLRKPAQQAILWSAGLNLFRDGLQFVQMLVLVRLLDQFMYGQVAWATQLINFVALASFDHIVPHVLLVRDESRVDYSEHFTAGVVLNGFLFLVTNAIALGLRHTATYAALTPLVHLLSLTFLLRVPADIRMKMLERGFLWSRLRLLQMAGVVCTVTCGIVLAVAGAGVYALVVPGLLPPLIFIVDLFVVERWRPRWRWSYATYRDALHFGLNRAGSNLCNGGRALLQSTWITNYFAFASLGVFSRADGLATMFCGRVSQEMSNALYPVVTKAEAGSERFQRISGLVLQSVAWVVLPIVAIFSLEARTVVAIVYGQKWLAVIPLLAPAMAVGAGVAVGAAAYQLLLANDRSRLCLRSDMASFVLIATVVVVLVPHGVHAFLVGLAVAQATVCGILLTMLIRTGGIRVGAIAVALVPPVVAAALGCVVASGIDATLPAAWPSVVKVVAAGAAFGVIYLVVLRVAFFSHLASILDYIPGRAHLRRLLYV